MLCKEYFIGPLCEECDIYNGYAKISRSRCFPCNELSWAITICVLVSIVTLVYILISIDSTINNIKILNTKMISKSQPLEIKNRKFAGIVIKIILHYTQILLILTSFDLKIVSDIGQGIYQLGSPIFSFTEIIDCYLVALEQVTGIAHIYLSFFVDIIIFIGIVLLFILYFSIKYKNNLYLK